MNMKINVTLGRQLGSGGSYLGPILAQNLGFRCLDREIISHTAQQYAIDEVELESREERVSSFWERMMAGFTVGTPEVPYLEAPLQVLSDEELFASETEVMKKIAQQEDCVIVGRGAGYVLPPHPGLINIFLYAPLEFRVQRVLEFYKAASLERATEMAVNSDAMRKRFVQQMTGRDWGSFGNYHLAIDTSSLPMEEIAVVLTDFVKRKIAVIQNQAP